jgi:hypothetical protein
MVSQNSPWGKVIGYIATLQPSGDGFLLSRPIPIFLGGLIPKVKPIGTILGPDGVSVPVYPREPKSDP